MGERILKKINFFDKKVIIRSCILFILSLIFLCIVPSRVILLKNYIDLTIKMKTIEQENIAISESLPSAKEVYELFQQVGFEILTCGVVDYSSPKAKILPYSGESLEPSVNRVLEFIVTCDDRFDYKTAILSANRLSFKSINFNKQDNNVAIEVYCK